MVTLLGFQYIWSGDLTVTLTYLPQPTSVDLFNRLGVADPSADVGWGSKFGGGNTNGGNYKFDSSSLNDLSVTASPGQTGQGDSIPDGTYFPATSNGAFSGLGTAFTGQNLSGTWELSISNFDPAGNALAIQAGLGAQYNSFIAWQLDIMSDTPEPSYSAVFLVLTVVAFGVRRFRRAA